MVNSLACTLSLLADAAAAPAPGAATPSVRTPGGQGRLSREEGDSDTKEKCERFHVGV